MHGELDALVPPANGRIIADRIPGPSSSPSRGEPPPGTDQPEQVSDLLVSWLDRHR